MRPRSKSLYIQHNIKDDEDIGVEEDPTGWKFEDDVKLIRSITEQIPRDDNLPFDERLNKIKWKEVFIYGYTPADVQKRFQQILNKCRTFRLLSEILKDVEKGFLTAKLPKKPLSPFFLFVEKNKEMLKEKSKKSGKFPQIASKLYNKLPSEEKDIYKNEALEIKKEYNNVISKYNLDFNTKNQKRTPFTTFWEYKKEKSPDAKYTDARKQFANFDKDKKLKWILKWLGIKIGQKLNLDQYILAKSNLSKEEMTIIDEYEERPKKLTAYANYMKDYILTHRSDNIPHNELFKRISSEWKTLAPEIKATYTDLSNKIKENYDKEFKDFIESLPADRQEYEIQKITKSPKKSKGKNPNLEVQIHTESNSDVEEGNESSNTKPTKKKKLKKDDENKSNNDSVQQEKKKEKSQKRVKKENENELTVNGKKAKEAKKNKTQKQTTEKNSTNVQKKNKITQPKEQNENKETTRIGILSPDRLQERTVNAGLNNEQDSDDEKETAPVVKRKIQNENTPRKKVKNHSESNANKVNKEKQTVEEIMRKLARPPSSVYKYYVLNIYKGPIDKAKHAFKSLSKSRRSAIQRKYNAISAKFLDDFKAYAQTLTPNELAELSEKYHKSGDDQISDMSSSEEESD